MASFGAWLRKSRDLRGLELGEVASATRLPPRILTALEADDLEAVPDLAYGLKYARAAAEAIGLDPEDAALRYEEWRQTQPAPTLPPPPGTYLPLSGRLWLRARALGAKVSSDPFVWIAIVLTIIACASLLVRR